MDILYERVSSMPVWPFDIGGLARVLTTIFFPIIGLFVDMVITGLTG